MSWMPSGPQAARSYGPQIHTGGGELAIVVTGGGDDDERLALEQRPGRHYS